MSLQRKIARWQDSSKNVRLSAQLQAAVLARRAEVQMRIGDATAASFLAEEAASTCIAANASNLLCDEHWIGWGMGSCCSILSALGKNLAVLGRANDADRAMLLARRLTVSSRTPGSETPLLTSEQQKTRVVLFTAASGKYNEFVEPLIASAKRFFLRCLT
eukprot:2721499-Rhodomonas_salina.2